MLLDCTYRATDNTLLYMTNASKCFDTPVEAISCCGRVIRLAERPPSVDLKGLPLKFLHTSALFQRATQLVVNLGSKYV